MKKISSFHRTVENARRRVASLAGRVSLIRCQARKNEHNFCQAKLYAHVKERKREETERRRERDTARGEVHRHREPERRLEREGRERERERRKERVSKTKANVFTSL